MENQKLVINVENDAKGDANACIEAVGDLPTLTYFYTRASIDLLKSLSNSNANAPKAALDTLADMFGFKLVEK